MAERTAVSVPLDGALSDGAGSDKTGVVSALSRDRRFGSVNPFLAITSAIAARPLQKC